MLDQDGNNGCGNDDDFEDDNKGRCLGRLRQQDGSPPPNGGPPQQPGVPPQEQPDHPIRPDQAFWTVVNSAFHWHTISTDTQALVRSQVLPASGGPQGSAMLAAASAGSETAGVGPVRLASTGASVGILALGSFLALLAGLGLRFAARRLEG
ncbi:MAG: hypothetical protein M3133_05640 [Actinomycetota bacterium]|nr:hypothetical protein [Actinomycetota bacterium]